jgi:hypothetical protein
MAERRSFSQGTIMAVTQSDGVLSAQGDTAALKMEAM